MAEMFSEERMGEIALLYVKRKVRRDSVSMDPEKIRREIGNTAKDLGISIGEATHFVREILSEAFYEVIEGLNKK